MNNVVRHRELWERLFPVIDPLIPAGDPSLPEAVRVDRPYSLVDRMAGDVKRPFGLCRELIYGASGAGKTTELIEMVRKLEGSRLVLMVDLRAHFEHERGDMAALKLLHAWEVLAVIGLAVHRFGTEQLKFPWEAGDTAALQAALAGPTHTPAAQVNVGGLAKEVALFVLELASDTLAPGLKYALKAVAAVSGTLSRQLPLGIPGRAALPDQDSRVQDLKAAVSRLIERLREAYNERLVLVVDGLDRGDAALARRLFEDSGLLAELPCHQLYAAPPSLRPRNVKGFTARPLCNLPVIDRDHPPAENPKLDFFPQLWSARARQADIPVTLLSEGAARRLGWASGGNVREFLNMLRECVKLAWDEGGPITDTHAHSHVETVIDDWRRRWELDVGSTRREALMVAARTTSHDDSELYDKLVDERCLVAFPNKGIWFYPHPLLTIRLLDLHG